MWRRIQKHVYRFFGLIPDEDKQDLPRMLEALKHALDEKLSGYNEGLAASAGLCALLKGQLRDLESRERTIVGLLESPPPAHSGEEALGELLLRQESLCAELGELRQQLVEAEKAYAQINSARELAISDARKQLERVRGALSEVQMREALADLLQHTRQPGARKPRSPGD